LGPEAIQRAEEIGCRWDWLEGLRALALGALLDHKPAVAAESCARVAAYRGARA